MASLDVTVSMPATRDSPRWALAVLSPPNPFDVISHGSVLPLAMRQMLSRRMSKRVCPALQIFWEGAWRRKINPMLSRFGIPHGYLLNQRASRSAFLSARQLAVFLSLLQLLQVLFPGLYFEGRLSNFSLRMLGWKVGLRLVFRRYVDGR
jgi:hypothetical protein